MNVRERNALLLQEAAACLDPLNIFSVDPGACLRPALEKAKAVWDATDASLLNPINRRKLRVAVVGIRGLYKASQNEHAMLRPEDADMVKTAAGVFRETALIIKTDPRVAKAQARLQNPNMTYSVTGARYKNLAAIAGRTSYVVAHANEHAVAVTQNVTQPELAAEIYDQDGGLTSLAEAIRKHVKIPKTLGVNEPFKIVSDMAIIAYPEGTLSEKALDRSGLDFTLIRDAFMPHSPALRGMMGRGSAILLNKQVVVGFRNDSLKGVAGANLMKQATAWVSRKYGPHVNPLHERSQKMLVSPGSHLIWMWLAPAHAISSHALNIRAAGFPWVGEANPESHKLDERAMKAARKELLDLENSQAFELRRGKELDLVKMRRMAELRQMLDPEGSQPEDTVADKMARQKDLREEAEKRIAVQAKQLMIERDSLAESLADMGKPTENEKPAITALRKKRRQDLKAIDDQIKNIREDVMARLRNLPSKAIDELLKRIREDRMKV